MMSFSWCVFKVDVSLMLIHIALLLHALVSLLVSSLTSRKLTSSANLIHDLYPHIRNGFLCMFVGAYH